MSRLCVPYNYGCFLFLNYDPLIVPLCLFCIIYILVQAITHTEFSREDVSSFESDAPTILANRPILHCCRSSCFYLMIKLTEDSFVLLP